MNKIFSIIAFLLCCNLQAELFYTPQMISSHLKTYSQEEIQLIQKDLPVVRSVCLDDTHNTPSRFYLATAGGPGSRKTTILEKFVFSHPEYQGGVYLDPDARALKFMAHTYYAKSLSPLMIATTNNYDQVIKNAYEKWRGGSNYITLTLMEESFALGRSIIHGTTSTGDHLPKFLTKLKENQYEVILLLCSCPDEMRYEAIDYRNQVVRFYQSSREDAVAKGTLFAKRMQSYFTYADRLYFYWSDDLSSNERLAGTWFKGKFEIHDAEAMQKFIDKYELDREALQKAGTSIPAFNTFLNTNHPGCNKQNCTQ